MRNRILHFIPLAFFYFGICSFNAQIGNYVSNGSFESLNTNSVSTHANVIKGWQAIDSIGYASYLVTTIPSIANAPYTQGYQYPRTGSNYNLGTFYCTQSQCGSFYGLRAYPRSRLKEKLEANKVYCAKYYVNNANVNAIGIDAFGIYFGDSTLDTIKVITVPLSYLIPQINNQMGIISDTLNWIPITGTFVATGNEKYIVLGNFKSQVNTGTMIISSTSTVLGTDVCMDDVSVIEVNLPAYAGPDKSIISGDSVYIGRESDFAIDPGCIWYKLPNTTTAIDTISGLWVKPSVTTAYVVKQTLECSPEKWDTVVIYINQVGIEKLKILCEELKLFPIPAKDELQLSIQNTDLLKDFKSILIFNNLGLLIREEELMFENGSLKVKTEDLPNGVYTLQIKSSSNEIVSKLFVISS